MPLIAVEGDTDTQDDCHSPPSGGGTYSIPVTLQDFVFINGKKAILKGQSFSAHETGYAGQNSTCSTLVFVENTPVTREGDVSQSSSCHTFSGITVSNQDFVYDNS